MSVVDGSFDHPLTLEEHAAMPLAGGIEAMGFQCGQIWGAALAAGAQAYRLYGPVPQAEAAAVIASQRLVEAFQARYRSINCRDVTRLDWKNTQAAQFLGYLLKGGVTRCFAMTAGYVRVAFNEINSAYSAGRLPPSPPVSCAAMLARKMGASEEHAVMAAGFAGGIGLSGGACGALGAAIWLLALNGDRKTLFNSPESLNAIDRFVESTGANFECSEIVGRRFTDVSDHAGYLRDGGCSRIFDALAIV